MDGYRFDRQVATIGIEPRSVQQNKTEHLFHPVTHSPPVRRLAERPVVHGLLPEPVGGKCGMLTAGELWLWGFMLVAARHCCFVTLALCPGLLFWSLALRLFCMGFRGWRLDFRTLGLRGILVLLVVASSLHPLRLRR